MFPNFGESEDERRLKRSRRVYRSACFTYYALQFGSISVLNFGYFIPRMSTIGLPLILIGNVCVYGTIYYASFPLLFKLSNRSKLDHHEVANKYKNILLEYYE